MTSETNYFCFYRILCWRPISQYLLSQYHLREWMGLIAYSPPAHAGGTDKSFFFNRKF